MSSKSGLTTESVENWENGNYVVDSEDEDVGHSDSDSSYYDSDDSEDDVDVNKTGTGSKGRLWLGFVEKPEEENSFLPSKAGGTPAWLDPIHLPTGRSFLCDFCEDPLQFVLQVEAPINGIEAAFDRTIFVFLCPSMICLRKDQHEQQKNSKEAIPRSVKVFRCQLPENKNHHCTELTNHSQLEAPLCSWCGTWKGAQLCSGCRGVRYCSKKHQILHWRSGHKVECEQSSNSCLHNGECASATAENAASNTLWPEYKLEFKRLRSKAQVSECKNSSSSLISIQGVNENMKSILEDFDVDVMKKSLASFAKHIGKDRAQVLRCWVSDGKPLWPESKGIPSITDIPKCSYCKSPMRFEFQIMPQLLYYFGVENEVDSLDWATIAIYSCEVSCDSAVSYKEEFPWVQLYS